MNKEDQKITKQPLLGLSLGALGIIYGDIGTSPLYAFRESFGNLTINVVDVLGTLSLILWTLILVISVKYLCIVFRADNEGEGGILALLALMKQKKGRSLKFFFIVSIFGAGLMLGDGMLTPAISILSAVEGINVIAPVFSHWVLLIACVILLSLFIFQYAGTQKIGFAFGPIILLWFVIIGILGVLQIMHNPMVLKAFNPFYAFNYIYVNGWRGYALLGGVFLVVTGGEALYADLGHFGKNPIRVSWFLVVLPGLLLNYFGQGAYLLQHPSSLVNPFYLMAPSWFEIPLLFIATMATIIASQAVISATFSLTKQAILLDLYPRLPIKQTSRSMHGQVYVPQMNFILALGTLTLIAFFKNSSAIAHAYGIAVNLVMIITTIMVIFVAHEKWKWSILKIAVVFSIFVFIEFAFLGANLQKLTTGGWVPIIFATICAFFIYTWSKGMNYLKTFFYTKKEDFAEKIKLLRNENIYRLPNVTSVFITDVYDNSGGGFLNFFKLNRVIPDNVLVLSYHVDNIPYVLPTDRYELSCLDQNICQLTLHYGFMDFISIPKALHMAVEQKILPFPLNVDAVTYYIEAHNIVASPEKKTLFFYWQEKLFSFLIRNYSSSMDILFYQLPYDRTIAVGSYCVI